MIVHAGENLFVQLSRLLGFKWHPHSTVHIGESLYTDSNRPMAIVAHLRFRDGVVIPVHNAIQVPYQGTRDASKLSEIKRAVLAYHAGQSNGREGATRILLRVAVFNNLGTQVAAPNGSKILLITLPIGGVFV